MFDLGGRGRLTFLRRVNCAFVFLALLVLSLSARADPVTTGARPLLFLPRPVPALAFTVVRGANALATWKAEDRSTIGTISRFLDGIRPKVDGNPRSAASRDASPHDAARERDATSLGVVSASLHGTGAAIGGVALGAGSVQVFDIAKGARKMPVKVGPMACLGGAGVTLGASW